MDSYSSLKTFKRLIKQNIFIPLFQNILDMKKIILSIFFLLFATLIFAQNETSNSVIDKSTTIGFAINIKHATLNPDEESVEVSSTSGYALEGSFFLPINSRITFGTGLNLSVFQFDITDYSLVFGTDISTASGEIDLKKSYLKNNVNWNYVGIPIQFQFKIAGTKHCFYVKAGGEILYNIYKKHTGEISESGMLRAFDTSLSNDPNKLLGFATLGMGMDFTLNESLNIFIEPNIEFGLNNATKNSATILSQPESKSRIHSLGCKIGVKF